MSQTLEPRSTSRPVVKVDVPHLPDAQPRRRSVLNAILWLVALAVLGAAGYYATPKLISLATPPKPEPPKPRAVPVVTAAARDENFNLYLTGLGTVTAFNAVTIRSRVQGELLNVAFTEGQMVEQGQLLAEIDPRLYKVQLEQAEGQLAKDQAALKNANLDLARSQSLVGSRAVTQQQVDTHAALVQQFEGVVKSDQAMVDAAKLQLSYCQITAPISGRIGLRSVDQGNMIHANDPQGLAVITQLQPIAVVFTIPQDDISQVQRRLNHGDAMVVQAYDRSFNTLLATGTLAAVDNQVDSTTGTLRLKAVFPNTDNELFPNQFVNARLLVESRPHTIVIPSAAVQRGPSSTFVYIVKDDHSVELRDVLLGPSEGDLIAIDSGLAAGEIVVTDGVDKLQPGSKVTTAPVGPEKHTARADRI